MIKQERQRMIVDLMNQNDMMGVADLAERLNCSMMTIRRDLESLENEGTLKRIHGAAINVKNDYLQPSFYDRIQECSEEKIRIGKAAIELIKNGDIVFFDGSTTALTAANNIPESLHITAVTNGLMTAVSLASKPNINVIIVGGDINSPTLSSVNFLAKKQIELFHADHFILSTNSISYPDGIFEKSLALIDIKKSFAARAKNTILLVDYRKFNRNSLSLSLALEEISTIITDIKAPPDEVSEIRGIGIEVIVV